MEEAERNRLWIGNLDEKITEYQLLKIVQKCGDIEKFDLLFHRSGPLAGKSRGYGFVSYKTEHETQKALNQLNGMMIGGRRICVKYAHTVSKSDECSKTDGFFQLPALSGPKKTESLNQFSKIRAIERKLQVMQQTADLDLELFVSEPASKKPRTSFNKDCESPLRQ